MILLDDSMVECVMLNKNIVNDGYGGYKTIWAEGAIFPCAISYDSSTTAKIAEEIRGDVTLTITTKKDMVLSVHDVFKRKSDGKIFRVTADGAENITPKSSVLDISQVTAEEWSLPSD